MIQDRNFTLLPARRLMDRAPQPWLLENLLPRGSFSVLYGKPKVGKSFLALHWALILAKQGNNVLYIAGEGTGGTGARLRAWAAVHERISDDWPLFFPDRAVNVHSAPEVKRFLSSIKSHDAFIKGHEDDLREGAVDLVVVDTLARCMVGADENSAGDVSTSIDNLDFLRQETGATVLVLHHATKNNAHVERGSSALRGAADVMMLLTRKEASLNLQIEAARDFESGAEYTFAFRDGADSVTLTSVPQVVENKEEVNTHMYAVLQEIKRGHARPLEIMELAHLTRAQVDRAIYKLLERGDIRRVGRGEYAPQVL